MQGSGYRKKKKKHIRQHKNVSFTNESLFLIMFTKSWTSSPNQTESSEIVCARAAQIYKLLNQNSLSDAWQSLQIKICQKYVHDPMMLVFADSFSAPVPPTVTELRTDELLIML